MVRCLFPFSGRCLAAFAALAASSAPAVAQNTYFWNVATGTWNTTTANWAGAGSVWGNSASPPNIATFGLTGSAVTVASGINVGEIDFNTDGYTLSGGTLNLVAGGGITRPAIYVTNASQTATISTTLAGSAGLVKAGGGTLLLNGANTFTGGLTVNAGTVAVDGSSVLNRLPANSLVTVNGGGTFEIRGVNALPNSTGSVDLTVNSGGTFRMVTGGSAAVGTTGQSHAALRNLSLTTATVQVAYSGAGTLFAGEAFVLNGDLTAGGGTSTIGYAAGATTGTIQLPGTAAHTFTVGMDATLTVGVPLSQRTTPPGAVTKAGVGLLVFAAANTYAGVTTLSGGTLQLGAGGTAGSVAGSIVDNATLVFNRSNAVIYAGAVSGTGTLTQSGAGTLTLTGTNTYSGGTTVTAGTLLVTTATATGSGAVAVNNVGTLGGTGTVGGAVTVTGGGTVTGGTATTAGKLTLAGGLTQAAGTYNWKLTALKDNTTGTAGTDFDQLALTGGTGTLAGGALALDFSQVSSQGPNSSNAFWNTNHTWTIEASSVATTGAPALTGTTYADGGFAVVRNGNDVQLVFVSTVVPEPGTVGLLAAGALGLGRFARRRWRRAAAE